MPRRLVFLPGLGADRRLFGPQLKVWPDAEVLTWIPPQHAETLPTYAARLFQHYAALWGGSEVVLVGVSFGGMVALELARHAPTKAVFLIASSRTGKSLKRRHDFIRFLLPRIPRWALRGIKRLASLAFHRLGKMSAEQHALCLAMLRDTDIDFFSWAGFALLNWEALDKLNTQVFSVHGRNDKIIPMNKVTADLIVDDAGHVLNLTHADIVNGFIAQKLRELECEA